MINRLANLQPPEIDDVSKISLVSGNTQYFQQVNDILNEFSEKRLPADYKFLLTEDELELNNKAFSQENINDVLDFFRKHSDSSSFAKNIGKVVAKAKNFFSSWI